MRRSGSWVALFLLSTWAGRASVVCGAITADYGADAGVGRTTSAVEHVLTRADFELATTRAELVLVNFFAPWCVLARPQHKYSSGFQTQQAARLANSCKEKTAGKPQERPQRQ